jgi:hypothetical protein
MIRWAKTQAKADIATLDEAIAWEELAMMTATNETTRAGATARLDAMRAAREAATPPSK